MSHSVNLETGAKRALVISHVVFIVAAVMQVLGLALYGHRSTIFLEGLALTVFALWVSFFEGSVLMLSKRSSFSPKIQNVLGDFAFFLHLLFLGITHALVYQLFAE